MSLVTAVLALHHPNQSPGYLLTRVEVLGSRPAPNSVFETERPLDHARWTGIVIDHLGEPAGDVESIHRKHLHSGYQGLGHHFVIGNGNGLGDGVVHVGYRWTQQLPGAHVQGRTGLARQHNLHSIGICLIGNGSRRPFTERQMAQLISLVQHLQAELDIPSSEVYLHRELAPTTQSPGQFFPTAQFRQQLLDPPRGVQMAGR